MINPKTRFKNIIYKTEKKCLQYVREYKTEHESKTLNDLEIELENREFSKNLFHDYKSIQGLIDLTFGLFLANLLGVLTHAIVTIYFLPIEPFLLAFEAIPVTGGIASIYRFLYVWLTLGLPQTISNVRRGKSKIEPSLRSLVSMITFGWVITPALRDRKNVLLSEILLIASVRKFKKVFRRRK